tara:strand:- start:69 stop:806 length:738 start_codon:yes stop_codon:yes gene_type:complete
MKFGDVLIGKRLWVGCGKAKALGTGEEEIRGSAYVEGPVQIGRDIDYDSVDATLMVGAQVNTDSDARPENAIKAKGNVEIEGDINQTGNQKVEGEIVASTEVTAGTGADKVTLTSRKPFDIPHPIKDGYRLRHVCLEGPESAVYVRGRVHNRHNVITLPEYWDGLVDYDSMTVQLTPIHSHQNVIVKRIDVNERKIHLQAQGGMPVDCFYHIMAERKDGEKLIVEYEGKTSDDYPGDNSIYSINK